MKYAESNSYYTTKKLECCEWQDSKEWKGKRLAFIWHMMENDTKLYMQNRIYEEKNEFYAINDKEVIVNAKYTRLFK